MLRPFKCQQCYLTFDRASQYDYHHRNVHLNEKSQLCEICGKGFFRKADLKTHLNVHLGTSACICEVCGKKFNHISNLLRHCRMHAGIKQYPCSICKKRFTQISSLTRHKRIHEMQKNDIKNQCQNNSCSNHVRNDDNTINETEFPEGEASTLQKVLKRKHYCKVCGESFSYVCHLREHEVLHTRSLKCKNNEMKYQEHKEHEQKADHFEFFENDTNIKKILPLETIIYITSEQLKKINLENIEDDMNNISPKNSCETNLTTSQGELNKSESIVFGNEKSQLIRNNPLLLSKSNNSTEKESITYVCEVEGNMSENKLCVQPCEPDFQKAENTLNYNALLNISANVTDLFQKIDLSESNTNDGQMQEDSNIVQCEKIPDDLNDINNIVGNDEPMLHLVQAETGDQFYEFLINNLIEKLPNIQFDKSVENNSENANLNEDNKQQNIRDDIHNVLNYNHYELQNEDKNFVLDTQTDFDKYVETNFEVFERLDYDDNSERFLEFVETAELGSNDSKILENNKDSDQLLQFQNFNDIDTIEQNVKNAIMGGDVNGQALERENNQDQNNDVFTENENEGNEDEESRKIKTFLIKFQCTVCEKSFSTSYNYKQHIGTHFADQQKFHCKDCKMSFAWKSTLNKHIANNHRPEGPQKFACDICNKIYNTSSQVNEHVKRDHLKQRNHVCSECGKSFFKKYDLKIHNRIHTDERPYVCGACGKRFHHRSHIIRHERTHF